MPTTRAQPKLREKAHAGDLPGRNAHHRGRTPKTLCPRPQLHRARTAACSRAWQGPKQVYECPLVRPLRTRSGPSEPSRDPSDPRRGATGPHRARERHACALASPNTVVPLGVLRYRQPVRPTDLRGILQYVPQFRDKTFIVAVDGAAVADDNFSNILMDVAVLWSLRIRTVLVHGASAQITAMAAERGLTPSDLDGSGVTDQDTLSLAVTAANRLSYGILEGLKSADLRAAVTNAVVAHPLGIIKGIDHLDTGRVERVDADFLEMLLANGTVPVVPPLGIDGEGRSFRLNSDAVAVELAKALSAVKLVYMTTRDGLVLDGAVVRQISVGDLDKALDAGRVSDDQVSKARHAVAACRAGVRRVHVISGHVDDGLLAEVFSNEGVGTLVYTDEYQQIRRARRSDVRAIEQLIHSSIVSEELAPRTRAMIERDLADYYIFEVDQHPIACVALHPYAEAQAGELACLYVHPSQENRGIGRTMVQFVEAQARERGFVTLLALSTQAFNYFLSKAGFREGTPGDLPAERRARLRRQRQTLQGAGQVARVSICLKRRRHAHHPSVRMVHGSALAPGVPAVPARLLACARRSTTAVASRDRPGGDHAR